MPNRDWDPRDPATLRDQRAAYDALRAQCPVAYSDFLGWSLFRHDDVVAVTADPETYRSASHHRAIPNGIDPPEHTLYRRVLEPFFDSAHMATFEPHFRDLAAELTGDIIASGNVELVGDFAEPFALRAQCIFLGWPPKTWAQLHGWMHGNQEAALSRDRAAGKRLAQELASYVNEAIQERRTADVPTDHDLTSRLMATEVNGQRLSDEDLVSILRNWIAGQGTVSASLGIVVYHLAENHELQQRLRQEPALIATAIDEILRTDGPLVANRRTTARPVTIGECTIEEGAKITLMWIAANRDPQAFDKPDEIQLDRDHGGNLLFGSGIHDCVGAALARLEMRTAIDVLLARTVGIELVPSDDPIRSVYPSNGFTQLPVRITPA